jgi:hypothetical protein
METKQSGGEGMSRQWVIGGVVGAVAIVAAVLIYQNGANRPEQSPYAGVTLPEAITVSSVEPIESEVPVAASVATAVEAGAPLVAVDAGPVGSVTEIQTALQAVGLYQGTIDGKSGPLTTQAIVQFQDAHQLTADGKVGPKTWSLLKPYLDKSATQQASAR